MGDALGDCAFAMVVKTMESNVKTDAIFDWPVNVLEIDEEHWV